MGSFLKIAFAACIGFIMAISLIFFFILLFGISGSIGKNKIKPSSVLLLDFEGLMPELTDNVPGSNTFSFESPDGTGIYDVIELIKHAATDSKVSHLVLKPNSAGMGAVHMMLLANAIKDFRETSDKPVYAYANFYTQGAYLISSEADSIYLNPEGGIDLKGFGVAGLFAKDFLDNIGVKMHVFYDGEFKSGAEMFYRNDMSENAKIQLREFLNSLHENYTNRLSENRNISKAEINQFINNYSLSVADSSLVYNAVDGLAQWYEFEDILRQRLDIKKGKDIPYVKLKEYKSKTKLSKKKGGTDRIAVVFAEGEIRFGEEDNGVVNEKTFHKVFDEIRKDDKIKAVVLRVDSPGGSAYASEAILQEVKHLQSEGLPVIASFSNYAASGGYYISCSADVIVAEENTLTGSIGAFSVFPDASGMLNDKVGLHYDTVKTGPYATGFNPFLKMTDKEADYIRKSNNKIYKQFLGRVAEGRGMTFEDVEKVAEGRVWTGTKAVTLNLVDTLGGIETAIEIAAKKADIASYSVKKFPEIEKSQWQEFMSAFNEGNASLDIANDFMITEYLDELKRLKQLVEHKKPQMLLPFSVTF